MKSVPCVVPSGLTSVKSVPTTNGGSQLARVDANPDRR